MAHDVFSVANEILRLAKDGGIGVDPLKLQKLVYLSHGWHLAFTDHPLIQEPIEAWRYGPVVPRLYREYRVFGASPITREPKESPSALGNDSIAIINSVWSTYKGYSAIYLSMLTHEPGGAWDIIRRSCEMRDSPVIPNDLIREEFKRRKQHGGVNQ